MPSSKRLRGSARNIATCVISSGCRFCGQQTCGCGPAPNYWTWKPADGSPGCTRGKAGSRCSEPYLVAALRGWLVSRLGIAGAFCGHFFCCGRSFSGRWKIQNHLRARMLPVWCLRLPEERSGLKCDHRDVNNTWLIVAWPGSCHSSLSTVF
jgi:hypothetical protein